METSLTVFRTGEGPDFPFPSEVFRMKNQNDFNSNLEHEPFLIVPSLPMLNRKTFQEPKKRVYNPHAMRHNSI